MAITARRQRDPMLYAAIKQLNALQTWVAQFMTTEPHADITSTTSGDYQNPVATAQTVTAAAAVDLPTTLTMTNQALVFTNAHFADALAHKAADTTNGPILGCFVAAGSDGVALPLTLGTLNVDRSTAAMPATGSFAIDIPGSGRQLFTYTGIAASTFTGVSGGAGVLHTGQPVNITQVTSSPAGVVGAPATDQASANFVLNAIKAAHNLHMSQAGVHFTNDAANTIATANATDLASSEALANADKTALNAHIQAAITAPKVQIVEA